MPATFAPPPPLTPPQRKLLWIATLVVAATRLFAMASSPWDWDEVQFMSGVREFDVGQHHPHPAGFPIYILLANVVQLAGLSDFRSLQVVTFLAACSLFPLVVVLARELGLSFRTSILSALLFVFFPNIWYFGGTVFSDITGVAITLAAIVMLLRGRRDGRDFLIGCALVGAALAVRPHAGFILLPPLLLATWHQRRSWGRILAGAAITAAIAVAAYGGAALASESVAVYVDRVTFFQKWVHDVDSIANPGRTPLSVLAPEIFLRPMGAGRLSMLVAALSVLALGLAAVRREAGPWLAFVTWAPYMVFAWLMHDPVGVHRYATAYVVVYALLAAYALEQLAAPARSAGAAAQAAVILLIVLRYAWWTWPALVEARSTIAPTHAASMRARSATPAGGRVWVDDSMGPWAGYYLDGHRVERVETPGELVPRGAGGGELFLTEGRMKERGATVFARSRGRLPEIHPPRHFEASVAPVSAVWRFGEGWSDPEGHGELNWRWMGARSEVLIPARRGRARLMLVLGKPSEIESEVEVRLNGELLERFPMPAASLEKQWVVTTRADGPARLEIGSSRTLNPLKSGRGSDPRDLGLQLFDYEWTQLP